MTAALNAEDLQEARRFAERAISGLDTLHIGPIDYNVSTTVEYLRTAAALLERALSEASR